MIFGVSGHFEETGSWGSILVHKVVIFGVFGHFQKVFLGEQKTALSLWEFVFFCTEKNSNSFFQFLGSNLS